MYFDSRMEPPEVPQPICPVCGRECEIIIKQPGGDVLGCNECLLVEDAWEYLEEQMEAE